MLSCGTTCLAGAVARAHGIAGDRLKATKESAYRLNENGERNQELIKQYITYLSLFPHDHEAKQLVKQLHLKLTSV